MISEETSRQLATLTIDGRRPLVVSDVDDVIVHFLRAFEEYLTRLELWLDPASLALNGNIRRQTNSEALPATEVEELISRFFRDMTVRMEPIDDAVAMLTSIADHANVILLTNAPHDVAEARRQNLKSHGLTFPVITNAGPKGPAIEALSRLSDGRTVFIDDNPGFLKSAHEWVPDIILIHFMQDLRFRRHVRRMEFVHLHTGSWQEAGNFILKAVKNSS